MTLSARLRRPFLTTTPLALVGLMLLSGCGNTSPAPADTAAGPSASASSAEPTGPAASASATPAAGRDLDLTDPSSTTVLVNKTHPLSPKDWAPQDLETVGSVQLRAEAAQAFRKMKEAAAADGVDLVAISGYRSYATQVGTYQQWVDSYGQERADVASARPGYSEHQTGLALDLGGSGSCDLQVCFKDTPAAHWVAEHAPDYGFVLRFPWMQHPTTGYWYESWHLRYLGRDVAQDYRRSGAATYEDFVGSPPAPDYPRS